MAYGKLTPKMKEAIRPYVEDKIIVDLGAGDLTQAKILCELGAYTVHAVEPAAPYIEPDCIYTYATHFRGMPAFEDATVVFISWPLPSLDFRELEPLFERAEHIIYLGSNYDGTACGTPAMFLYLLSREIEQHIFHRTNDLIIYGRKLGYARAPIRAELAGIDRRQVYSAAE